MQMRHFIPRAFLFAFASLVGAASGCGGESKAAPDGADGGADESASDCAGEPPPCIRSCGEPHPDVRSGSCLAGVWVCASGTKEGTSCSEGSCARGGACCNPVNGQTPERICGANGFLEECPGGTSTLWDECIPNGLTTNDCGTLDDLPCGELGLECHSLSGLDYVGCICSRLASGDVAWACAVEERWRLS